MITPEQLAKPGTEHSHQVALFCWSNEQQRKWQTYAETECDGESGTHWIHLAQQLSLMFAIPNGGLRHKAEANKLKSEGVKAGVPDIFLPVSTRHDESRFNHYNGLFIEMKKPSLKPKREATLLAGCSKEQRGWLYNLQEQGYQVAVCYSWQEARDVILAYLGVA